MFTSLIAKAKQLRYPSQLCYLRQLQNSWVGDADYIVKAIRIVSIHHKYTGTLSICKAHFLIRIGCETHSISEWEADGVKLATKYDETLWWEETGKHMLALLISAAKLYVNNYLKSKPKRDSKGRFCK